VARQGQIFFLLLIAIIILLPFLAENFQYAFRQFERLFASGDFGSSANMGLEQLLFVIEKAKQSGVLLFFGNGPAKSEMEYAEPIYVYFLYRYGIIGLILFLSFWTFSTYCAHYVVKMTQNSSGDYSLKFAILIWLLVVAIFSVGNNFIEQFRVSQFYYLIIGYVVAQFCLIVQRRKGMVSSTKPSGALSGSL